MLLVKRRDVGSVARAGLCVGLVCGIVGALVTYGYFSFFGLVGPLAQIVATFLMFAGILFSSLLLPARLYLLRLSKLKILARLFLLRGSSLASLRIVFGALGFGVIGYFLAETVTLAILMFFTVTAARGWGRLGLPSGEDLSRVWEAHKRFLQFETPATLLNTATIFAPLLIVSSFFGSAAAGIYALAFRLIMAPVNQIAIAAGDVFQTTAARHLRAGRLSRFRRLTLGFLVVLVAISLVAVISAMMLARHVTIFFGDNWARIAVVLHILAPWMAAAIIVTPLSRLVSISGKQHWKLFNDIIRASAVVGCIPVIMFWSLEFQVALAVLCAANVASYVIYAIILIRIVTVLGYPNQEIEVSKNA
ncbi:MAG: hypothetical protein AAFV47_03175 [Pseudomonadota bacterium]